MIKSIVGFVEIVLVIVVCVAILIALHKSGLLLVKGMLKNVFTLF